MTWDFINNELNSMSKRNSLVVQYNSIRESIKQNLMTVRALIEQLNNLAAFSESLSGVNGSEETKRNIDSIISGLKDSIINLVNQNEKLFEECQRFAKEIFND